VACDGGGDGGDQITSADLRWFVRRCVDADQVRRVLALALILDGGTVKLTSILVGPSNMRRSRLPVERFLGDQTEIRRGTKKQLSAR
jgi:hypothetical protein